MREAEHEITVAAPADTVYRLIADVANWPQVFEPTIYVDHVERSGTEERIRIWATANGEPKSWTSRRLLDPAARRIEFRQEVSTPPVASMGGTWLITERSATESHIRLLHHYRAVDDHPQGLNWIDRAVDRNSRKELAGLKTYAEAADHTFSFADTVAVAGSAKDVYDFVNDAQRWPERLPHVVSVQFGEDTPGLQTLEMDTRAKDGSTHTTKSYRVAFPHRRIAYKQTTLPALMSLHTGLWTFEDTDRGVAATSQHTVRLNHKAIERVLGPGATAGQARAYVQEALSTNSLATLGHARAYAESKRH